MLLLIKIIGLALLLSLASWAVNERFISCNGNGANIIVHQNYLKNDSDVEIDINQQFFALDSLVVSDNRILIDVTAEALRDQFTFHIFKPTADQLFTHDGKRRRKFSSTGFLMHQHSEGETHYQMKCAIEDF